MPDGEDMYKARRIEFPRVLDDRGNLSFLQESEQVPFAVKRVYWICDVPGGEVRGSHAFRQAEHLIVALSGSFELALHDGREEQVLTLNRSYYGVYVPPMHWRTLREFSTNSVALVLASTHYDESDYIRDYDAFLAAAGGRDHE